MCSLRARRCCWRIDSNPSPVYPQPLRVWRVLEDRVCDDKRTDRVRVCVLVEHALPYLQQLLAEGAGMTFGVGVIGLAALCASRDTRTYGVLLTLLALPTTLLYMAYYFPPDGASMRFLVPTLFVYPIASVWLLKILAGTPSELRACRPGRACCGLPCLGGAGWRHAHEPASPHQRRAGDNGSGPARARRAGRHRAWRINLSCMNLDFVGGWRLADASILQRGRRRPPRPRADDHGSPTPMYEAGESRRRARYEALRGPDLVGIFVDDVWTFADGADTVYWFAAEEDVERIKRRLTGFGHDRTSSGTGVSGRACTGPAWPCRSWSTRAGAKTRSRRARSAWRAARTGPRRPNGQTCLRRWCCCNGTSRGVGVYQPATTDPICDPQAPPPCLIQAILI